MNNRSFFGVVHDSVKEATLIWTHDLPSSAGKTHIRLLNVDTEDEVFFKTSEQRFTIPLELRQGNRYLAELRFVVKDYKKGIAMYRSVGDVLKIEFKAEFNKREMQDLLSRATSYVTEGNLPLMLCVALYRNKPQEYFDHVFLQQGGMLEPGIKDWHGDPANPANGEIWGTYFGAGMDRKTGRPPDISIYGSTRINIRPDALFHDKTNIYFSDFYCMNSSHYVLLVLTPRGSPADIFCLKKLIQLDRHNNPFLHITRGAQPKVFVTTRAWVEVFYTDRISLPELLDSDLCRWDQTESGEIQMHGGLPKNKDCNVCNLSLD